MCHHPQCRKTFSAPQKKLEISSKNLSDTNTICWGMKGRWWRASGKTQTLVMAADISLTPTTITLHILTSFTAPIQLLHTTFEMPSLPCNFLMGYFYFALTQNELWLLAVSARIIPPVDGLRTTKQNDFCNQHFNLQALITLCSDHLFPFPQSRKLSLARNKKFSRSSLV